MSGHLLQSSLRVIAHQPLGDTAGLAGRLILNGLTLDMDEEGGVHKLGRLLRRKQSDASANLRTGADSRWKSNLIQSVVDAHCGARSEPDGLFQEVTQQRKGEKPVGNGAAEGRVALGAFRVKVNPLAVLGGVGKFLDTILGDDEPVGRGEFASFALFQRI
jgi:hypothetical protein